MTNRPPTNQSLVDVRFWCLTALVVAAALSRLVPHPFNFSPLGAIALFGGACFASRRAAVAVPLAAMALSDLALAWWNDQPSFPWPDPLVYLFFTAMVAVGFWLRSRRTAPWIAATTLVSSVLFFLTTNFAAWLTFPNLPLPPDCPADYVGQFFWGLVPANGYNIRGYPKTPDGLISCFVMGLAYFHNTLLGDLFYVGALFGGRALVEKTLPGPAPEPEPEPAAA